MQGFQRNAWRGLLAIAVLIGMVGLWALFVGIAEDASVPLGITGLTLSELEAESPNGYRLADFEVRAGGMALAVIGTLLGAIVMFAFRQGRRWAWWTMWALPFWALSTVVLMLAIGVAPGQAPPWPMISGSVIGLLSASLLLVSAPRFIRHDPSD